MRYPRLLRKRKGAKPKWGRLKTTSLKFIEHLLMFGNISKRKRARLENRYEKLAAEAAQATERKREANQRARLKAQWTVRVIPIETPVINPELTKQQNFAQRNALIRKNRTKFTPPSGENRASRRRNIRAGGNKPFYRKQVIRLTEQTQARKRELQLTEAGLDETKQAA